jgi:hypothetical protein
MVLYTASQHTEKERPALSKCTHAHDMNQLRCLQTVLRSSIYAEIRCVESVLEKVSEKKAVSILYSKKRHRRHVLTEEKLD